MLCADREFLCAQHRFCLGGRPQVVLPFFTLRIRVQGGVVSAVGVLHVSHHPVRGFCGYVSEECLSCCRMRIRVNRKQCCVVVEHLLEMWDRPIPIYGVTEESSSEMVVEPPLRHARKRKRRHVE